MRSLKTLLVVVLILCLILSFAEATKNRKKKGGQQVQPQSKSTGDSQPQSNSKTTTTTSRTMVTPSGSSTLSSKNETAKFIGSLMVDAVTLFSIDHILPIENVTSSAIELVESLAIIAQKIISKIAQSDIVQSVVTMTDVAAIMENATFKNIVEFFPMAFVASSTAIVFFALWVYFHYAYAISTMRHLSFGVVIGILAFVAVSQLTASKPLLTAVFFACSAVAFLQPHVSLYIAALLFSVTTILYFHFYDNGSLHFDINRSLMRRPSIVKAKDIVNKAFAATVQSVSEKENTSL